MKKMKHVLTGIVLLLTCVFLFAAQPALADEAQGLNEPGNIRNAAQEFADSASRCFSSSIFPHFRHSTSPLSSWEIPHFQQALSGYRFHNCVLPHKGMFHSVASSTSHQEMAVVSQSVNHGSGHLFIGEDAAPF